MKPCNIGMAVVIREEDDIRPLGFTAAWSALEGVFAAITRSDRERRNGVLCNNSLMRGIMARAYRKSN